MIKSSIEKMAFDIGFDIGNSDDKVQSDLLNGFCKALNYIKNNKDLQLCYIFDKLDETSIKILSYLIAFKDCD